MQVQVVVLGIVKVRVPKKHVIHLPCMDVYVKDK